MAFFVDYNPIINYIDKNIATGRPRSEIEAFVPVVLQQYHFAILNGAQPFVSGTEQGRQMALEISQKTSIPTVMVMNVLYATQQLASEAKIPVTIYNPTAIPQGKGILTSIGDLLNKPVESGFNKILIAGAIVAVIYLLGKEMIKTGASKSQLAPYRL